MIPNNTRVQVTGPAWSSDVGLQAYTGAWNGTLKDYSRHTPENGGLTYLVERDDGEAGWVRAPYVRKLSLLELIAEAAA
jgi:hypothetical protein